MRMVYQHAQMLGYVGDPTMGLYRPPRAPYAHHHHYHHHHHPHHHHMRYPHYEEVSTNRQLATGAKKNILIFYRSFILYSFYGFLFVVHILLKFAEVVRN